MKNRTQEKNNQHSSAIKKKKKHKCYGCAHKFTYPLQNEQNVNNWNKIRGIMKIACYCLFSTVLNKLFHITDVYIYSTSCSKVYIPRLLMHCVAFLSISKNFHLIITYSHFWKGFKYAEDAGKPKNVQELGDSSEEQQAVEQLLRTNKGLMNKISQNIKTVVDHPGNDT